MKRRTDNRRVLILAAIKAEAKTIRQVQLELGIPYSRAFYTLNSLNEEGRCRIDGWVRDSGNKPMAKYIAGGGRNAMLGEEKGRSTDEIMSADTAIRTAVFSWVRLNKENQDGDEQQEETGVPEGVQRTARGGS